MHFLKTAAVTCVLLSSIFASAQCGNPNALSSLRGNFAFVFNTSVSQRGPNNVSVIRPASFIGAVAYDGKGNATLFFNGVITSQSGKSQAIFNSTQQTSGTYCFYSNGWGTLSSSDGTWVWNFIMVATGQELETLARDNGPLSYVATFSQKKQ